jgi:hypothetical protein
LAFGGSSDLPEKKRYQAMTPDQIRKHYKRPQKLINRNWRGGEWLNWTLHPKSKRYPRKVLHISYEAGIRTFKGQTRVKDNPSGKLGQPQGSLPKDTIESVRQMLPAEDLAACVAASIRHMQMAADYIPF